MYHSNIQKKQLWLPLGLWQGQGFCRHGSWQNAGGTWPRLRKSFHTNRTWKSWKKEVRNLCILCHSTYFVCLRRCEFICESPCVEKLQDSPSRLTRGQEKIIPVTAFTSNWKKMVGIFIRFTFLAIDTLKACWEFENASVPAALVLLMYLLQVTSPSRGCSSWKWVFWRCFSKPGLRYPQSWHSM